MLIFSVVIILWFVFGYSLAFTAGNKVFGDGSLTFLNAMSIDDLSGSINRYIHVAFQGSFAVITLALIVGALGERVRFQRYSFLPSFGLLFLMFLSHIWYGLKVVG